jgi:SAM-dependent methyltransferase
MAINNYQIKNKFDKRNKNTKEIFKRYINCYKIIAKDNLTNPIIMDKMKRYIPLKKFIETTKGKRILDVGSGDGTFLSLLKGECIAFDISYDYLKSAKDKGLATVQGIAEALPFKPCFDIVICSEVLEHVLDPIKIVNEIKRILPKGKKLYVTVPYNEDLSKYKKYEGKYEFTHLRTFDENSITKLLNDFKITKIKCISPRIPAWDEFRLDPSKYIKGKIGLVISRLIDAFDDKVLKTKIIRVQYLILVKFVFFLFHPIYIMVEAIRQ